LIAGFLAVVVIPFVPHRSQQHVNISIAQAVGFTLIALLLWLLFASRLRWRMRLLILAGAVGVVAGLAGLFRVRGVTGNLVPILEPRWASRALQSPSAASLTNAPATVPGAADFPQFLGPRRNGSLAGPRLATNWTARPPALLWRQPIGTAWSGFVVAGSRAVTQEQRGEEELTVCYDLLTGRPIWSHAAKARYFTALAGEGPRATPAISGGRVFSQGATGMFSCLDLETGRDIWSRDVIRLNDGSVPSWGHSSSPLVLDDLVIVNAGGSKDRALVACRAADGSAVWNGGNEGDSYSSPLVAALDGVRQVILFSGALVGHDSVTGRELWRFSWPGGHPHIAMPLVVGETDLIVSSGYGTGSGRVRIKRDASGNWSATPVWRVNRLKAKFTNPVLHRNHVYGLDDGILACLDAVSGELRWKDGRYGHGQTLLVGGLLLVTAESGEVILVDPQPDRLRELSRFSALTGKTWNPPALAGEYLLVRNDKEAACYRLPVE
jgi:outer membrane protein assembly factor BamB